jgi:ubiquinone/menaquinone biosynthesis C-methylase UbiE
MNLREAWEGQAAHWIRWARKPGHDTYWRFHRQQFLSSLPSPGRLTLDIGCGEGRLTRDLAALGHRVVGVDVSPSMLAAAREADPDGEYVETDAATLPFDDGVADLAIAFMSLMDMDDMHAAVREIARVLEPGRSLLATVVHPLNSAGNFVPREGDETAPYVMHSYREARRYADTIGREGLEMTFESMHYSLEDYWRALRDSGFAVDELRELYDDENPRWRRVPLFLRLDARKPA